MDNLTKRFENLSVDVKTLENGYPAPSDELIDQVYKSLVKKYKLMPIYNLFGHSNIKYICKLSSRFALYNLGNLRDNIKHTKSFALWLSLVWIIDGAFDKYQKKLKPELKNTIIQLIKKLGSRDTEESDDDIKIDPRDASLSDVLLETVRLIYSCYIGIIRP